MTLNQIAGILPAVVFPAATIAQLLAIVRARSTVGVSLTTWLLFGFANVAVYVYAERFSEWQAIAGMLGTAVLDFAIVALIACGFGCTRTASLTSNPTSATRSPPPESPLRSPAPSA